jgi:hypothetical protein
MARKGRSKLTAAERAAKRRNRTMYEFVFVRGKQVRVRREPTSDGLALDEFLRRNADPGWLQQNEQWELMPNPDEPSG